MFCTSSTMKKKNWVTQADYTFRQHDCPSAPPCTEGLVLSLLLTSPCSRMEKQPQDQDLHIKKDSCIWQTMHRDMTSKEPQGHLTAHFLLKFPWRKVLQGYEIQCFVFFNSLTFKTQRCFTSQVKKKKKKSPTLKNPKTEPPEMTSGCNWDPLTKLTGNCYPHLNTVSVLSPFFLPPPRETKFRIRMQGAHYSGRGPFLDIKCKAYCDKTPLSPSQNQAIYQPFIRKTKPSTVLPSSQSTAFIITCARYWEIKQKKDLSLALQELETGRKRICALCLGQKIRTQWWRVWALKWDWLWCNRNSQLVRCTLLIVTKGLAHTRKFGL